MALCMNTMFIIKDTREGELTVGIFEVVAAATAGAVEVSIFVDSSSA